MANRYFIRYLMIAIFVALFVIRVLAQTTQFTYQGSLSDGASPANGAYDFQFKLFDRSSDGAQVGSTFPINDLNVVAGIFTVTLDFGSGVFPGPNRWLEISVRPGASTGAYTTLNPRQQINSTPYAIKSLNAATADGLSAACVNCVTSSQIGGLPTGSGNYIQNRTTQQTSANFNISGNGALGGSLTASAGIVGASSNTGINGVTGTASTGATIAGVFGVSTANNGNGMIGEANTGASAYGVWGRAVDGRGVYGNSTNGTGVFGTSSIGRGVYGTSGGNSGVYGENSNPGGYGVYGKNTSTTFPCNTCTPIGVYGEIANSFGIGVSGYATGEFSNGVVGKATGQFGFGVIGEAVTQGVVGRASGPLGQGVHGESSSSDSHSYGVYGSGGTGVYGKGKHSGVEGYADDTFGLGVGVMGIADTFNDYDVSGVYADANGGGNGVRAYGGFDTNLSGSHAGWFGGSIFATGAIIEGVGQIVVDHPLDPENKYLYHSSVESPEMKNVYDGVATLDDKGEAEVVLPNYFEAFNRDFRYQLTCIGGFAPVYVAREVSGNRFKIAGGQAGMKVSWQVTGIRQDAYATAYPFASEIEKSEKERGSYLHPEAFGQPEEKSAEWALHPERMKERKERREQFKKRLQQAQQSSTPSPSTESKQRPQP